MIKQITADLDAMLDVLPLRICEPLRKHPDLEELWEVILDLGRIPKARYLDREVVLDPREVTTEDIDHVVTRIGSFGDDNRAGIERTLHRISAIRNRKGRVVGLTCRVGRAVFGTIGIIQDLVESGKSTLLLGRPGVGKTTMLREVARVLADDLHKRVIIVDTSNEIAGDGDIPHPAIGHARRMQVPTPSLQHAVMIEAVENHMPEVIVIDEMGTELEATAARTIAERGVQLIATAHGNTLENLINNPTLSDLVGGIQTVTLGDDEARRRGTQKSILERKAPPTFDIVVEIQERDRVAVHPNVSAVVDAILRGRKATPEVRWLDEKGEIQVEKGAPPPSRGRTAEAGDAPEPVDRKPVDRKIVKLFPFGVNRARLEQAARETAAPTAVVSELEEADILVTSKHYYRRRPQKVRDAEAAGIPVYVLKTNTPPQMRQLLSTVATGEVKEASIGSALQEAEEAISQIMNGEEGVVELSPQSSYVRRLQHQMAEKYSLSTRSQGREPVRRVHIFKGQSR
ncbi:MAG: R3H domain-containing nucleic acid-binding protein [Dehalococcoidia bacterium]